MMLLPTNGGMVSQPYLQLRKLVYQCFYLLPILIYPIDLMFHYSRQSTKPRNALNTILMFDFPSLMYRIKTMSSIKIYPLHPKNITTYFMLMHLFSIIV